MGNDINTLHGLSIVVKDIKTTKLKVIELLRIHARYRDNDEALTATYWWIEAKSLLGGTEEAFLVSMDKFLRLYSDGKFTPADIITRARRKAQEENPELRGSKWKERHDEEKLVRDEINEKLPKHGGGYTP